MQVVSEGVKVGGPFGMEDSKDARVVVYGEQRSVGGWTFSAILLGDCGEELVVDLIVVDLGIDCIGR